jgi:hypothetical protein
MPLGRASAGVGIVLVATAAAGCGATSRPEAGRAEPPANGSVASSPADASALGLTRKRPRRYRTVCAKQAEQAPAGSERCPPLIPKGRLAILYSGRLGGRDADPGGFSADLASPSIAHLRGRRVETNGGHWRYDVAWTAGARETAVARGVIRPPNAARRSTCRRRVVAGQRMRVCRVVPYEDGGGINGGHIAYVWRHGSTAYVISLHGYRNRLRARAMMGALVDAVGVP